MALDGFGRSDRGCRVFGADERITIAEAIRAYTRNGAFITREEQLKGTLEPGKLADIAVLSNDLLTVDPARILGTVPREGLWRAQTPQGFPRTMLVSAIAAARREGRGATDDAALCEAIGAPVTLIEDLTTNFKITSAADFVLAEAVAKAWR